MILLKTAAGQQAFKERHGALSLRQRSAFLLFDGKRTLDQVLAATHSVGIGWDDVRSMIESGLLELADKTSGHRSAKVPAPVDRVEAHEVAEEVAVGVVGSPDFRTLSTEFPLLRNKNNDLESSGTTLFASWRMPNAIV